MIVYDLLLVIFALLGVFLTFSENDSAVITGIMIVSFCILVYLIMFVLYCVWNRKAIRRIKMKKKIKAEEYMNWDKNIAKELCNKTKKECGYLNFTNDVLDLMKNTI